MNNKVLILRDPWRVVEDGDTGWGNRLFCWSVAVYLRELLGNTHDIVVKKSEYPELVHLSLPYTRMVDNLPQVEMITDHMVYDWIKTGIFPLDSQQSYETDFRYETNAAILINKLDNTLTSELTKMHLHNNELTDTIKKYTENKVGIHVRRGNGVRITEGDLENIPEDTHKYYMLCDECDKHYRFVSDQEYFNLIDSFLETDPATEFYISIDVDEKAIKHFKKRYPGKIHTAIDFIKDNNTFLQEIGLFQSICGLHTIGQNLLDFFILTYSKHIIQSRHSTWSMLAQKIAGGPKNGMIYEL